MFKKTITFKDFNDVEQSQDFYFHLSKAELLEMAADNNVMMTRIQRIIDANDGKAILNEFRELIRMACGLRSEDGSRFLKTPEAQSVLMDSPAFDELLMELATNAEASIAFLQMLIPEQMQKDMAKQMAKRDNSEKSEVDPFKEQEDTRPDWEKEHRNPTDAEIRGMSREELQKAFRNKMGQ